MTAAADIEARVLAILTAQAGDAAPAITSTSRLIADLGWDSLDIVEVYMEAESEFGIVLDDEPDRRITAGGVVALVMRAIATQKQGAA